MNYEGDFEVVKALKEKKRLMEAGQPHDHLKILCICGGGMIKGAYSVGVGLALEELGFTDVFDDFVGISSGAPSAAYFLGGNVHEGGNLIYDECCSRDFFNPWRLCNLTDVPFLRSVMEGATGKRLRFEEIFESRTTLHIGVADRDTGRPRLVRPKNQEELLDAISASVLMPALSNHAQFVSGVPSMDGGFSSPHVIGLAAQEIDYTHVLVLTSQNKKDDSIPLYEHFLNHVLFRYRTTQMAREAIRKRKESLAVSFSNIRNKPNTKSLFVWGDGSISGTNTNSKKVAAVVVRYRQEWLRLLQ